MLSSSRCNPVDSGLMRRASRVGLEGDQEEPEERAVAEPKERVVAEPDARVVAEPDKSVVAG